VFNFVDRQQQLHQIIIKIIIIFNMSRGSSGSIVSDYGLDDRAIEVRSPTGVEEFSSSPCVQTGSGGPPSLLASGYRGSFPRG
jgi:hypothetical protein